MKSGKNSTIVQKIYSETFSYKNDPNDKTIMFLFLKINIHLINTLSSLSAFYFGKPIIFIAEIPSFLYIFSEQSYEYIAENC